MKKEEKISKNDVEVTEAAETLATEETANDPEALEEEVSNEAVETQLPPNVEKIKGRWWLPYVISFAVLAVLTVLVGWARGCFIETDIKEIVRCWCDAFSVTGILGVCFGLLVVGSNGGAFDMLAYGVRKLFSFLKKDPIDRKYGGYYEYQQARREKKRSFWYLLISGGVYLLVGVILLFVYYKV